MRLQIFNGLGVIATMSAIAYYVLQPPWLTYGHLPLHTLTKQVHPGDAVQLMVTRCNSDNTEHVYPIARSLIRLDKPQVPIVLPGTVSSAAPGCATSVSRVSVVPPTVVINEQETPFPPGIYKIVGFSEAGSEFRDFSIRWESEQFEVL